MKKPCSQPDTLGSPSKISHGDVDEWTIAKKSNGCMK